MKSKFIKKAAYVFSCAALLTCSIFTTASAAEVNSGIVKTPKMTPHDNNDNITTSGPLTIETHLNARLGYPEAYYRVFLYAPSDVIGIRINDMDILSANSVCLTGTVKEVNEHTGIFESITVKVTLFYEDKAPYVSYETINVNHWCIGNE